MAFGWLQAAFEYQFHRAMERGTIGTIIYNGSAWGISQTRPKRPYVVLSKFWNFNSGYMVKLATSSNFNLTVVGHLGHFLKNFAFVPFDSVLNGPSGQCCQMAISHLIFVTFGPSINMNPMILVSNFWNSCSMSILNGSSEKWNVTEGQFHEFHMHLAWG